MAAETCALTRFWIRSSFPAAPLGFGVTARSLEDAIAIIRAMGYVDYLPNDLADLRITAGIAFDELDPHVAHNMGPMAVRGMWYPFMAIGVPGWAHERIGE
jgi:hypothetical protein